MPMQKRLMSVTKAQEDKLVAESKATGLPVAEVVRRIIDFYFDHKGQSVAAPRTEPARSVEPAESVESKEIIEPAYEQDAATV